MLDHKSPAVFDGESRTSDGSLMRLDRPDARGRRPTKIVLLALLALWLVAMAVGCEIAARAAEMAPIVGRAVVTDGDTIIVAGRTVRLSGIDAPEIGQTCENAASRRVRCGRAAADAMDALVGGRTVACRQDDRDPVDRYGRAIATCAVDGRDIGLAMIEAGMAIAYERYLAWPHGGARPHRAAYLAAQHEASASRRGLWAGRFDRPEDWRRRR